MTTTRQTDTALAPIFLDRWSPRAFDGSSIPVADLRTILDAGRWAPSSFNYQPWRFLFATRDDTSNWQPFLDLLLPFNADWARNASALVILVSERNMGDPAKPSHTHSFDAGAAWASMALQAHMLGYHAHAMAGLDMDRAREVLAVPDEFRIEAAVAIGRMGDPAALPEKLRAREFASDRKPLDEIAYAGAFQS